VEAKFYNDFNHSGKELFCAEHYPLPAKEDEFLQRVQQKSIMVYNSITDPLFKIFGGERIEALMKGMGIKDEEVLTHAMISKSIRKAQEKLAASIPAEQHSSSQAQWFSRNFPEK
jgi:predicted urease superfamily metal-dependent hydrolase